MILWKGHRSQLQQDSLVIFPLRKQPSYFLFLFYILQLQISVNIKLLMKEFGICFSLYSIWLNIISLWWSLFAIKALFIDNWAWEWNLGMWRKYSWFFFQGKIILASFLEPAKYEANDSPWFQSKIQDYSLTVGGRSPSESLLHLFHCLFKAHSTQIINDRTLKLLTRRKCIVIFSLQKFSRNIHQIQVVQEKYIDQRKKRKKWMEGGKEGEKGKQRRKKRRNKRKWKKGKESSAKRISSLHSQKIALETDKLLS